MIQIKNDQLDDYALEYFEAVKVKIEARVQFYQLVMDVLFNNLSVQAVFDFPDVHWKTKPKGINHFLFQNKMDGGTHNRLEYDKVIIGNIEPWVFAKQNTITALLAYLAIEDNVKHFVLASPLDGVRRDLQAKIDFGLDDQTEESKSLLKWLLHIIDYDFFGAYSYDIATKLGINTCPYCNRNYINTVIMSDKNLIRPQFDHFFPRTGHQFLALSFYNLIPSCYYCNSSLKSAKNITHLTHLHPYLGGFGEAAVFHYDFDQLHERRGHPENFTITLAPRVDVDDPIHRQIFGNSLIEGNNNLFRIADIYHSAHRDIVGEMLDRTDSYSIGQADSIAGFLELLSSSKAEFYQFYFGNYIDEVNFNRRPMAKFTRDLIGQMIPFFFDD